MNDFLAYIGPRAIGQVLAEGMEQLRFKKYEKAYVKIWSNSGNTDITIGVALPIEQSLRKRTLKNAIGWVQLFKPFSGNIPDHLENAYTKHRFQVILNGKIENTTELLNLMARSKKVVENKSHSWLLMELLSLLSNKNIDNAERVIHEACSLIKGEFGMLIIDKLQSDTMFVACHQSNLVIGFGEDEMLVSTDAISIVEFTNRVLYLKDDEVATLSRNSFNLKNIYRKKISANFFTIN